MKNKVEFHYFVFLRFLFYKINCVSIYRATTLLHNTCDTKEIAYVH